MSATSVRVRRIRQPEVSMRVTGVGAVTRADTSRQIQQENAFTTTGLADLCLIPPYPPAFLYTCVERSNMLKQCIAAIVTNVALGGFDISPIRQGVDPSVEEADELQAFIDAANSEESLTTVHGKIVEDYETFGYAFLEVIRDKAKRVTLLRHSYAARMRLLPKDQDPQKVTYEVNRGSRSSTVVEYRTFRRYAQIVNGKPRYFREYGDQRILNMNTGVYGFCPEAEQATEIIHFRQNSEDPYGVPRWINQLPSILGSRESEECNLRYFEDNTVPPIIMTVAGGRLTTQSYREMVEILQRQALGKERQNKIILIEAVPERDSLDDKGNVSVSIDKLTDARQSDGLFKEYDEGNQAKVRSSFRLPPVAVGLSQDVTFATANVSAFIAESQVYLPQRNIFDEIYNKRLVNSEQGLGLATCKLVSRVPLTSNSETTIKSMTALNTMGALTPRMANALANKLLQVDIPQYPSEGEDGYEEWMDKPIIFVSKGTASDAGQNQKDESTKAIEAGGTVGPTAPEHGQE
jgi:PBSX family phage portal protein